MKKKEKNIDTKIDELAQVVSYGFADVHKEIRGVDKKVSGLGEKLDEAHEELKGDIANIHNDMTGPRDEFKADLKFLRSDIDIMLDRHIGTFRKDYDDLARRVKDLEKIVLTH